MKTSYLYFLISALFLIAPYNSSANKTQGKKQLIITQDMQYAYANKLFDSKDFDTALVEYNRFIHFFPDSEHLDQAQFNIAVCKFYQKKYHDAARAFNQIIIKGKENDLTIEAFFYQSRSFINAGKTAYAQIVLQNFLKLTDDTDIKDRIYYNLVQLYLSESKKSIPGSLSLAQRYLQKISDTGAGKYNTDHYADLIFRAEHAPKKNPAAAGLFAIIPGGGFLYCGRYKDALVTFLLNAGLIVATYQAWDNDNEALAGVLGFVETGFYTGNIYGSITSAHKYNKAQILKILNTKFSITSRFDPKNKAYELSLNYPF
ncbi:MAG: tetratricopeptide repeat protein [Desulfobacteraceae bacterium]|nr:tetratricopeptide repeat protein [Desulfobacteraceae bacterium]